MLPIDPLEALFAHVARQPARPAVVERGETISYGRFGRQVRGLAAAIAEHAPAPRVLIACPKGGRAYAAMFATLMAGGFYAPVNVAAPPAKQRLILERFRPDLVVGTVNAVRALLGDAGARGIGAGVPVLDLAALPETDTGPERPAHELAYVIFTSGSTGVPKGVMVPRAGLANYLAWVQAEMAVTPEDRWSQHPNIGFDLSVLDIYGALGCGAALFPLSDAEARLSPGSFIRRNRLTIWNSVPSVVDILSAGEQLTADNLASLRLMSFCGEPLLPNHLEQIFAAHPGVIVHNTYGPTEATVSCTLVRLEAGTFREACQASVSIGEAIPNMGIHLLGGGGADPGGAEQGEIVITGVQAARGYWADEAATARAFRPVPRPGGPVTGYYTGDWAERRDGRLYFKTRLDFQVKINGFRVELDEVNAALRRCGAVAAASALIKGELHAFVQPGAVPLEPGRLRAEVARLIDAYAVPRWVHILERLPLSGNDKVDLKALIEQVNGEC